MKSIVSETNNSNVHEHPVATEILPFDNFYPAETEHQDYYPRNKWDFYIKNVSKPKVMKMRKALPELIKSEYKE
ncbi:MAG: hypothetical protein EOO92_15880 [Pedobacter sp.]|nr:MAG: hypothetical protein EOO92_15880 [Pedobacter sp.]